jgi:hypothetical protein
MVNIQSFPGGSQRAGYFGAIGVFVFKTQEPYVNEDQQVQFRTFVCGPKITFSLAIVHPGL